MGERLHLEVIRRMPETPAEVSPPTKERERQPGPPQGPASATG
jgi:hypothetical protein